jgi:hypothetical protein
MRRKVEQLCDLVRNKPVAESLGGLALPLSALNKGSIPSLNNFRGLVQKSDKMHPTVS